MRKFRVVVIFFRRLAGAHFLEWMHLSLSSLSAPSRASRRNCTCLCMSLDSPRCRHPVWPDGGSVFADMSRYAPLCCQLLVFYPAVCSLSHSFRLILTFCYCFYEFIREQELGTGRLPDTDKADSFHGQTIWVRFNDCVPDF